MGSIVIKSKSNKNLKLLTAIAEQLGETVNNPVGRKITGKNTGVEKVAYPKGMHSHKRTGKGRLTKTVSDIINDKAGAAALKLGQVETEKKIFLFDKPILFQINREGKSYLIENEQLDIFAAGLTKRDAKHELCSQFEYSFRLFNELNDEQLSDELLKVKQFYNLIVKQVIDK